MLEMDSLKLNDLFSNPLTSKCLLDLISDIPRLFNHIEYFFLKTSKILLYHFQSSIIRYIFINEDILK